MKNRKGIILAGGTATRLFPATLAVSKQMLTVYDKPMIYYPLSVLMLSGIREVLIISTPRDMQGFQNLLGDGSQWGMRFEYKIQEKPRGLADAFIIGEDFIGEDNVAMVLGDNMFYGQSFGKALTKATERQNQATVFGYYVKNPIEYGVIEIDDEGNAISIEEKPKEPKSNYAIPGLYFFTNEVVRIAKTVEPSARGELEITSVMNAYLEKGKLKVEKLGRGMTWFDTGSHDALIEASSFIQTIQKRQGIYVACPEEIAYNKGFINKEQLIKEGNKFKKTEYGKYLLDIAKGRF